jgi:hypothetical protein
MPSPARGRPQRERPHLNPYRPAVAWLAHFPSPDRAGGQAGGLDSRARSASRAPASLPARSAIGDSPRPAPGRRRHPRRPPRPAARRCSRGRGRGWSRNAQARSPRLRRRAATGPGAGGLESTTALSPAPRSVPPATMDRGSRTASVRPTTNEPTELPELAAAYERMRYRLLSTAKVVIQAAIR